MSNCPTLARGARAQPKQPESTNFAQSDMNADLLVGMVFCLLALSGAAFGYYLTFSVVLLLLLFNNMFFDCFNSRTVKRWFTKKGGRLKPDKTARKGEDPFKVSGREILANMDKNTKQALRKAKHGLRNSLSGVISYIAEASLVQIVIFRDSNADARPGKGNCYLFESGGSDGLRWGCGEGGGDRLGSGNGADSDVAAARDSDRAAEAVSDRAAAID
jgi:hypothetical protein